MAIINLNSGRAANKDIWGRKIYFIDFLTTTAALYYTNIIVGMDLK